MFNAWTSSTNIEKLLYITKSIKENNGWARYSKGVVNSTLPYVQSFVLTSDDEIAQKKSTKTEQLPPMVENYSDFLRATIIIYKKLKHYDAAHCLIEPYIGPTFVASILRRKKYYLTLHGTYAVINFKKPIKASLKFLAYHFATGITSGSLQTISKLPTKYIREKIRFIPNGYDKSIFFPDKPIANQPYLLTVGNLKARKGQDIAIEALSLISNKDVKLICVGSKENSNFFNSLVQKADDLGVIVDFKEDVSDDELRTLYTNAICTVSPSRNETLSFEGFPMVIYESTACGTPIIITRGCGSEYAISEGKNGFLLETPDPLKLALTINKLMELGSKKGMMEFCLQYASLHTWDKVGKKIINFYQGG
jgi:glycosyltransferase involved in cell wall biosynthesis